MTELGYRAKRRERRMRQIQIAAGAFGLFAVGFGGGWLAHQPTFVPLPGATPVPCLTLAVFPSDVLPEPEEVTVNVLNGSRRIGMASITAEVLGTRGFKVGDVGNFEGPKIGSVGQVQFGPAGADIARLVEAYVPGVELVNDGRPGDSVDLIIGQKFEDILTKAQAAEVLSRPFASPSGPGC